MLQPGVILAENDDKEEKSSSKKWSDRGLMDKYGKITAIGIEEEKDGDWIQRIRARCLLPHLLLFPLPGTAERRKAGRSGEKLEVSLATREPPKRWS